MLNGTTFNSIKIYEVLLQGDKQTLGHWTGETK